MTDIILDDKKSHKNNLPNKIIIIGGVAAGTSAAVKARRISEKAEIIIYEKYKHISYGTCGLPYYVSGQIKDIDSLIINTAHQFEERFNIQVNILHEVIEIKPEEKTLRVRDLRSKKEFVDKYDSLIIASGSSQIITDQSLHNAGNAFSLRTIDDAINLKEYMDFLVKNLDKNIKELNKPGKNLNAVIIGGGYIGLELIDAFLSKGFKVTVIEKTDHILPIFDREIIEYLQDYLEEKGVSIFNKQEIKLYEQNEDRIITSVTSSEGRTISSDILFLGMGAKPQTELASACGIITNFQGAISVDEYMQTNKPGIFAAGDCCECKDFVTGRKQSYFLASIANMQGRCAGINSAGGKDKFTGGIPTSIIKILDITIGKTGLSFKAAKDSGVNAAKIELHALNHAGYYPGAKMLHMMLIYNRENGLILGFEAIGKEGVDKKTDILSIAIKAGMKVKDLAGLNLCYHPEYGAAKDPINILGMIGENIENGQNIYMDVEELKDNISRGEDIIILDVRTRKEYNLGHIEGAVNIPIDELRDNLDRLDKNSKIIVHCRTSYRSYLAYRILKNNGFANVWNLNGSYLSWVKKI